LIDSVSVGWPCQLVGIDARQPAVTIAAINAATRATCVLLHDQAQAIFSLPGLILSGSDS
jgi:hypothetical protein